MRRLRHDFHSWFSALLCLAAVTLLTGSGCAHLPCRTSLCGGPVHASHVDTTSWPLVTRGRLQVDVSELHSERPEPPAAQLPYQVLLPEQAECLAAEHSATANLLLMQQQWLACSPSGDDCNLSLLRQLITLQAAHERNEAAAEALTAFYRLTEAELARQRLEESIALVDRSLADLANLRMRGLPLGVDESTIQRQRWELIGQLTEVDGQAMQLNFQLRGLLGMRAEATRFWPEADLRVTSDHLPADAAAAAALANRGDLAALRLASTSLAPELLPVAEQLLPRPVALRTAGDLSRPLLNRFRRREQQEHDTRMRCQQLGWASSDLARTIELEARAAAAAVDSQFQQIVIAQRALASHEQEVAHIRARREGGTATLLDLFTAELQLIETKRALESEVIAWRVAQIELARAQGLLGQVNCSELTVGYAEPAPGF